MKKLTPLMALVLGACASNPVVTPAPKGISGGLNGLQASPCNCGGLESEEAHEAREKRKREAAKTGTVNHDIVEGDY